MSHELDIDIAKAETTIDSADFTACKILQSLTEHEMLVLCGFATKFLEIGTNEDDKVMTLISLLIENSILRAQVSVAKARVFEEEINGT